MELYIVTDYRGKISISQPYNRPPLADLEIAFAERIKIYISRPYNKPPLADLKIACRISSGKG